MKTGAVIIGVAIFTCSVALAGFGLGVAYESRVSATAIGKAKGEATNANGDAKAARDALTDVQRRLQQQKADLDHARQIASLALQQRDAALNDLSKLTQQRSEALRTAARESPECADLRHLPICPAVADRLFSPANDPPSGSH
ncbi:hypothetical protein [Dyella sp. 2RAB6]|uniref:hypothetical protein n=1 Tax=Dyella sp. 2RAB6 TaxID=3232992 RepID=UPI003F91C738